ncbi:MAG: hypothetical protein R2688_08125 [Fimbriimonadaceae bacterium]
MDFLGLSNLTVLARTIENIKASYGHLAHEKLISDQPVLIHGHTGIPFDDQKTYDMLGRAKLSASSSQESGGMRRNIIELKPQSERELAAMVALYRPGPMEHIPEYISNKFGRTEITYLDPKMEPILGETYGVIVYQDQVLKLVQALAGSSLGKADILRRAMGKKDAKVMDAMMGEFVQGCQENGVSVDVANQVWEKLKPFAGYAFNKGHAVCHAILAYQTAYLKANYPVEYVAAMLAVFRSKEDRVTTSSIEEARRQKIPSSLPMSIAPNLISPSKKSRRKSHPLGLAAIKNVGEGLVRGIIEDRENGPFEHLYEFCDRVRPHGLNKSALEGLIRAGALDSINKNRNTLMNAMEGAPRLC